MAASLLLFAGGDASEVFAEVAHSRPALQLMETMRLARCAEALPRTHAAHTRRAHAHVPLNAHAQTPSNGHAAQRNAR
eukprot:2683875-Pleurochrysis_carterae.AAC.1